MYYEKGDPQRVLSLTQQALPSLARDEVLIRMIAAPVNPADINMIQGVYPIQPPIPAVGGIEGVGEIMDVGSDVKTLKPGEWVVPGIPGWGTWRTWATGKASDLIKVPSDLPLPILATMDVTICSAYRLLKDFERLHPGDTVIQNGANSGVGKALIQIASHFGLQTINIVRNRPNLGDLMKEMEKLGATHVVTDDFVKTPEMKSLMKTLPQPKLACNCVGGKGSAEIFRYLADCGTMVTYGGMSKQPLFVPAGPFIFRDIKLRGFWITLWNAHNKNNPEKQHMWDFLCGMARDGLLAVPNHRMVKLENFQEAIIKSMDSFTNEKQIFTMTC